MARIAARHSPLRNGHDFTPRFSGRADPEISLFLKLVVEHRKIRRPDPQELAGQPTLDPEPAHDDGRDSR